MTNGKSSNCERLGDIVAYMYGELTADSASSFESHLLSCTECTDEFAEISSARYDVYEWKKLEFDHLTTPVIVIPASVQTAVSVRFIQRMRMAFGNWAVPSAAFAALALTVLSGGLFWKGTESDIAVVNPDSVLKAAEISVTKPAAVANPPETSSLTEAVEGAKTAPRRERINSPDRTPQRKSVKPAAPRLVEVKQTSARNRTRNAPTLNDFADDEDTSLRLAQLFDDIGTLD